MWKRLKGYETGVSFLKLQLSHIHMNVETRRGRAREKGHVVASIEPHSYECGNGALAAIFVAPKLLLQLSHIHMNVETSTARLLTAQLPKLQLSHIHMNVETGRGCPRKAPGDGASIEPHSYECGNRPAIPVGVFIPGLLQLSHIHMNVETISIRVSASAYSAGFN